MNEPFDLSLSICGEFRRPRQMLADQSYDGHLSIHDNNMAKELGFRAGPIEGPTHFSQFIPLLHHIFGNAWFERGCIRAHYQNMVVEGKASQPSPKRPARNWGITPSWVEKRAAPPVRGGPPPTAPDCG